VATERWSRQQPTSTEPNFLFPGELDSLRQSLGCHRLLAEKALRLRQLSTGLLDLRLPCMCFQGNIHDGEKML
jgi:hypothetical protein